MKTEETIRKHVKKMKKDIHETFWHPDPDKDRKLGGPGANQRAREDRAAASKPNLLPTLRNFVLVSPTWTMLSVMKTRKEVWDLIRRSGRRPCLVRNILLRQKTKTKKEVKSKRVWVILLSKQLKKLGS